MCVARYQTWIKTYSTNTGTHPVPVNLTPMAVNSIFRLAPRTYAPRGPSVRVVSLTK